MRPSFPKYSIRFKLLTFTFVSLILVSSLCGLVISQSLQTLERTKAQDINANARLMLNQIGLVVLNKLNYIAQIGQSAQISSLLNDISHNPSQINDGHIKQLCHAINTSLNAEGVLFYGESIYQNVLVTDSRGYVLVSSQPTNYGTYNLHPWWQKTLYKGGYVEEYMEPEATGGLADSNQNDSPQTLPTTKYGLSISVRINNEQGQLIGIIRVIMAERWLTSEVAGILNMRMSDEIRLVNNEGRLLFSSRPYVYYDDTSNTEYFALTQTDSIYSIHSEAGRDKFYVYAENPSAPAIGNLSWKLFFADDLVKVRADITELTKTLSLVIVIALVFYFILSYFFGTSILRPLARLQKAANRIADGELDIRLPSSGAHEIVNLNEAFNSMSDQLHRHHERLNREAATDSLTGVTNRRYFMKNADQMWQRCQRYHRSLSLLIIDIDHFKQVNDKYGHDAGDNVLLVTAQLIEKQCRRSDVFGRIGGEEFAILLEESDLSSSISFAEKIRWFIADQTFSDVTGKPYKISVSIGIATRGSSTDNFDKMYKRADQALYKAKENGRNRVEYFNGKIES